ncbi:hypothetical protein QYE76_062466 [Lolium multiflorum]|uniref:Uncharacterized protein n=1 Tax=Lolium multiflorum TaxID=4521 RepID=A0AAD8S2R0_LOLMU|nr:hypothetical protein QYE76_062466 [Lolium multiflorum]
MATFVAHRGNAELVVPARATAREARPLSDIDSSPGLRSYMTLIEFFGCRVPGGAPKQLASSLKAALAEALVYYYPVAGRLRELPGRRKLVVDCTAEGAVFVEARADVRLEDLGTPLVPPFPCVDELICDVGDVTTGIGKPLLYLQMTQLRCGGLVVAMTTCHSVADGFGMVQILRCILDLARGQPVPAVFPLWERHLLASSIPAAMLPENEASPTMLRTLTSMPPPITDELVTKSFLFGPTEIAALRRGLPGRLARSSTVFELITAAVWRCRVAALEYAPDKRVRVTLAKNARGSWKREPRLPPGFYGNAVMGTTAEASAGELCRGSLVRAVELVREAKLKLTDERLREVLDLLARNEYAGANLFDGGFAVSDMSRCGNASLELGSWAERIGGGTPGAGGVIATLSSIYMSCKDSNGDECVAVPMCLPELPMRRFMSQIAAVTKVIASSSM